ncbi:hypothetical protein C8J56DRAFT_890664 [Mycena floridula]|nr:hypothetical protein C8J56DRAFT_890664 [Mycena floridula]
MPSHQISASGGGHRTTACHRNPLSYRDEFSCPGQAHSLAFNQQLKRSVRSTARFGGKLFLLDHKTSNALGAMPPATMEVFFEKPISQLLQLSYCKDPYEQTVLMDALNGLLRPEPQFTQIEQVPRILVWFLGDPSRFLEQAVDIVFRLCFYEPHTNCPEIDQSVTLLNTAPLQADHQFLSPRGDVLYLDPRADSAAIRLICINRLFHQTPLTDVLALPVLLVEFPEDPSIFKDEQVSVHGTTWSFDPPTNLLILHATDISVYRPEPPRYKCYKLSDGKIEILEPTPPEFWKLHIDVGLKFRGKKGRPAVELNTEDLCSIFYREDSASLEGKTIPDMPWNLRDEANMPFWETVNTMLHPGRQFHSNYTRDPVTHLERTVMVQFPVNVSCLVDKFVYLTLDHFTFDATSQIVTVWPIQFVCKLGWRYPSRDHATGEVQWVGNYFPLMSELNRTKTVVYLMVYALSLIAQWMGHPRKQVSPEVMAARREERAANACLYRLRNQETILIAARLKQRTKWIETHGYEAFEQDYKEQLELILNPADYSCRIAIAFENLTRIFEVGKTAVYRLIYGYLLFASIILKDPYYPGHHHEEVITRVERAKGEDDLDSMADEYLKENRETVAESV